MTTTTSDTPHTTQAVQPDLFDVRPPERAPDRKAIPPARRQPTPAPETVSGGEPVRPPRDLLERERLATLDVEWRRSCVFPERYAVSSEGGHILALPFTDRRGVRHPGGLRKSFDQGRGYLSLQLHLNGEKQPETVHRLVCESWNGPAPGPVGRGADEWCVDHLDEDKRNNDAKNLAWTTNARNASKAKRGSRHHNALFTEEVVAEMRRRHDAGEVSPSELAEEHECSPSAVYGALSGRTWSHVE